MIRVLDAIGLNAEGVTFGVVLAAGFLGTRAVCLQVCKNRGPTALIASAVAGLLYSFAPIVSEVLWSSPLPRLIWIGLLPCLTAGFIRHQRQGGRGLALLIAASIALCSPAVTDIPGTFPAALVFGAVVVICWVTRVAPVRLLRVGWLAVLTAVANAFWLIPAALSVTLQGAQVTDAISSSGKSIAVTLVRALAPQQRGVDGLGTAAEPPDDDRQRLGAEPARLLVQEPVLPGPDPGLPDLSGTVPRPRFAR